MFGVDPATRGERMNECLAILRQLLTGTPVSFHGAFFDLDDAVIAPASAAPIPIIIGGRSDLAIRRAGRLGDGWLGIWNSLRFAAATQLVADEAARSGRDDPPTRHAMQAYYQLPFERFERSCPYGTADDVAEFLTPYADAGCTEFNLIPQSPDHDQAIAGVAAVKKLLART